MKYLTILSIAAMFIACNVGSRSTKTQVPTQAYVYVVGDKETYKAKELFMQYDDKDKFPVEFQKEQTNKHKIILYEIQPGTHNIKVYEGNKLIINTKAFISNQETKKIILP
jgi:hypothetical protein